MATLYRRELALDPFTRDALSSFFRHSLDFYPDIPWKQLVKGREVIRLCEEDMFLHDHLQTHEDYEPTVCHVCRKVTKLQDVLTCYGSCGVAKQ